MAICPKCGAKSDADLNEFDNEIICFSCLEQFTVPFGFRTHVEEKMSESYSLVGASSEIQLDSSFWLS